MRRWHARLLYPITGAEIRVAMETLIGERRWAIVMHSSLSNCGYIIGGPRSVIDTVQASCELCCLPTHTYCYPPRIGDEPPVYDVRRTPSRVGAITEFFRRDPSTIRSINPSHSLAAAGPGAHEICAGHEDCDTPCGYGTPYWKLVDGDASALLFGVGTGRYTFFHTAEDAADCDYLYYPDAIEFPIIDRDGKSRHVCMKRQDMRVKRRFHEVGADLEAAGLLRRVRLGRGEVSFIPNCKTVHHFVLDQIQRNPFYLVRNDCVEKAKQAWAQASSRVS